MVRRLLDYSPKEMLALKPKELKEAIRLSEGRIVYVLARSAPNIVQNVSNPEVAAAFGADIVGMASYNPNEPIFSGIPSKDRKDDEATKSVGIQMGKGWTLREIRELIGRPMSINLEVPPKLEEELIDHSGRSRATFYSKENAELAISQGIDIMGIGSREGSQEDLLQSVYEAKKLTKDKCLLSVGVQHPLGSTIDGKKPYDLRKLFTPETVKSFAEAGVDIIQVPAVGCYPGYDVEYVHELFSAIHEYDCLASAGLQRSQEGADIATTKRIALYNKMAGMDILTLGDAGLNEGLTLPENIFAVCLAIKGKRHTYRRMAQSTSR